MCCCSPMERPELVDISGYASRVAEGGKTARHRHYRETPMAVVIKAEGGTRDLYQEEKTAMR